MTRSMTKKKNNEMLQVILDLKMHNHHFQEHHYVKGQFQRDLQITKTRLKTK